MMCGNENGEHAASARYMKEQCSVELIRFIAHDSQKALNKACYTELY